MVRKILKNLLALFILLVHILPFYILVVISFRAPTDTRPKWILPGYLYLDNFINAWNAANLPRALVNDVSITTLSVVLVILLGSMAGYPLSRFRTRLNTIVYIVFISCMIVPPLTILVPLYKLVVDIGGMNTYWGIITMQITFFLPISIFLFTGFIGTVPKELDEAAYIDGSSGFGIFFKVIMPLLKPVTATVAILAGVGIWNDYQFSLFFLQRTEIQNVPVALGRFFGQFQNQLNWVAAGCLIGSLPMALTYLFLQRYFIKGLAAGAVKG